MKLSTNGVDSVTYGEVETNKFGFIFNGKMAEILSSKLYTDKYYAPVRELICNARDAHVAAGNADKPFIVHLPCKEEPYFSVRDFGIGLTHEDVVRIFTQYGATTKDDTNDAIGCLGLGSKSPFAYTEAFRVKAYKNGVCNTYLCSKESGIPEDTLFGTCKTDEPDGVEVKFDVHPEDFSTFAEKLKKMFFLKKYITVVDKEGYFHFPEIPNRLCAVYDFLESSEHRGCLNQTVSVEMGGVIYSVEAGYGDLPALDSFRSKLGWGKKVIIHAEIGDIDIAVSREHVEFTKKTKTFINNAIVEFEKSIRDKIYAEINKEPDPFRKLLRYKVLRESYGSFGAIDSLSNHYSAFCGLLYRSTISSIIPRKRKVYASYVYNDFQAFGDLARRTLKGNYPVFLDLVPRQSIPPEVRRAVESLGEAIHCIRSAELIRLCKRLNIPVHDLSEYAQYKPVRTVTKRSKQDGDRPKSLNTAGFCSDWSTLVDIKRAYADGKLIYWLPSSCEGSVKIPKSVERLIPDFLKVEADYQYRRYDLLMRDFHNDSYAYIVNAVTPAAEKRASADAQFVNFKDAVTAFFADRERVKRAIEYIVNDSMSRKISYIRTYGDSLCKVLIELFKKGSDRCPVGIIPWIKKYLLSQEESANDMTVPALDKAVVDGLFGYTALCAAGKFSGFVNKSIEREIPLLDALLNGRYGRFLDLGSYPEEIQKEINEYLRTAGKRLTKKVREEKNKKEVSNN